MSVVTWWYWISILRYWLVFGGTGSEQGGTGCQGNMLSENTWFIEYSEKEKVLTYKRTDRQTDRISYLRRDPFCGKGRVKAGATFIFKMILFTVLCNKMCGRWWQNSTNKSSCNWISEYICIFCYATEQGEVRIGKNNPLFRIFLFCPGWLWMVNKGKLSEITYILYIVVSFFLMRMRITPSFLLNPRESWLVPADHQCHWH